MQLKIYYRILDYKSGRQSYLIIEIYFFTSSYLRVVAKRSRAESHDSDSGRASCTEELIRGVSVITHTLDLDLDFRTVSETN